MSKKRSEPSLDKYGTGTQTETERTKNEDSKKEHYYYPVQIISNCKKLIQET